MQWIKAHLMIVIVGSVSVLSLTGLVLGFVLSSVGADLETDSRTLSSLQSVKPVNPATIDVERRKQAEEERLLKEFLQRYKDAREYPLVEEKVFTETDRSEWMAAVYRFQERYAEQQRRFFDLLKAQDAPSEEDFSVYEEELRRKREKEQAELSRGLGGAAVAPQPGVAPSFGQPQGGPRYGGAMATDEESRKNRMTVAISRAKSVRCYASPTSFDNRTDEIKDDIRQEKSDAELIQSIWYAQVALWVQDDVLRSLAKLNDEAAAELASEGQWVAFLPVKRLVKFAMGNYLGQAAGDAAAAGGDLGGFRSAAPASGGDAGGIGAQLLTTGPNAVFTKRASTDTIHALRFQLQLVVDARRILAVLDAVAKAGFNTPVSVEIQSVDTQADAYYIYGTAPIVSMDIICDTCFLCGSYDKRMPVSVREAIKAGQAGGLAKGASIGGGGGNVRPMGGQRGGPAMPPEDLPGTGIGRPTGRRGS